MRRHHLRDRRAFRIGSRLFDQWRSFCDGKRATTRKRQTKVMQWRLLLIASPSLPTAAPIGGFGDARELRFGVSA
jgi:hypothetical protein